jgi:DNA adenine methylase Dam
LNYTGGKYKLLPQLLPLFPKQIDTFVDLFCGGCNVGVNVNAKRIICNDIEEHVIGLMNYFKSSNSKELVQKIETVIEKYGLSNTALNGYEYYNCNSSQGVGSYNKDKYLKLRSDYNKDTTNDLFFYIVVLFAFSNQIRFNSKGEFNMPVNKRDFNDNVKNNTIKFVDRLKELNIIFTCNDFNTLKIDKLSANDLIYCDPPYLITCASYNEQDGWNEQHERNLLQLLDNCNSKGIKFALSNVLENNGKKNEILIEWCKKYNVHYLNADYSNSNYHKKDKENKPIEVLITNYKSE